LMAFFAKLPACLVGMEACPTAHFWARQLRGNRPRGVLADPLDRAAPTDVKNQPGTAGNAGPLQSGQKAPCGRSH
jgi:hypothetical protein